MPCDVKWSSVTHARYRRGFNVMTIMKSLLIYTGAYKLNKKLISLFTIPLLPSRYLGGVFDVESLVEKLLQQLASKQTILVNVYDTTNCSHPISMYGLNVSDDGLQRVSTLNFGDPFRKHEMHCR